MLEQGALWIFLSNFQHTALRALGNNAGESLNHFSRPLSPISSLVCFPKSSNLLPFPAESPSLSVFNWISAIVDFLSSFQKLRTIHSPNPSNFCRFQFMPGANCMTKTILVALRGHLGLEN